MLVNIIGREHINAIIKKFLKLAVNREKETVNKSKVSNSLSSSRFLNEAIKFLKYRIYFLLSYIINHYFNFITFLYKLSNISITSSLSDRFCK